MGYAKMMQLGKGTRRVSAVELPAQHLNQKVKSHRTGISPVNFSRDLAEIVINSGV